MVDCNKRGQSNPSGDEIEQLNQHLLNNNNNQSNNNTNTNNNNNTHEAFGDPQLGVVMLVLLLLHLLQYSMRDPCTC